MELKIGNINKAQIITRIWNIYYLLLIIWYQLLCFYEVWGREHSGKFVKSSDNGKDISEDVQEKHTLLKEYTQTKEKRLKKKTRDYAFTPIFFK